MSSSSSNPNTSSTNQPTENPGLISSHAEYIKGAAEVTVSHSLKLCLPVQ